MKVLRPRIKPLAMALLSGLLGVCAPAGSVVRYDLPPMDGLQHASEVPDELLGQQRGKFAGQGRVINFGIEMESTWRTDKGDLLRAGATLVVDGRGHGERPEVRFVPVLTIGEALGSVAAQTIGDHQRADGGNGVSSVNGVAQSIQVAGDANHISNDAAVTIGSGPAPAPAESVAPAAPVAVAAASPSPASAPSASAPSASAPPASVSSASPPPTSATVVAASGASVHAAAEDNGLVVAIVVPSVGRVVQQVRGSGAGGIVQMAQAAGDQQWISNRMNIFVNLEKVAGGGRSAAMNETLNMLRGLRPMGAF